MQMERIKRLETNAQVAAVFKLTQISGLLHVKKGVRGKSRRSPDINEDRESRKVKGYHVEESSRLTFKTT